MQELKVRRTPHKVAQELKALGIDPVLGPWQYIYTTKWGRISCIRVKTLWGKDPWVWEIYSGDTLFKDVERFPTRKLALVRIKELLKVKEEK